MNIYAKLQSLKVKYSGKFVEKTTYIYAQVLAYRVSVI